MVFAKTNYIFRIQTYQSGTGVTNTLERRSTADANWIAVGTQMDTASASLIWATYDQNNPDTLCFRYFVSTVLGSGYPVLQCSTDSGNNWTTFRETTPEQIHYDLSGNFIRSVRKISGNQILISTTDNEYLATPTPLSDLFSKGGTLIVEKLPSNKNPVCAVDAASRDCLHEIMKSRPRVWYDPFQPGQGLTVTEVNGGSWSYFTAYDVAGKPMWWLLQPWRYIAGGNLNLFSGPPLGSNWDASSIHSEPVGSAIYWDEGPSQMRLDVAFQTIFGNGELLEKRSLTLVPFDAPPSSSDTPDCSAVPANHLCADAYLNGWPRVWYDPAQAGQGLTLTAVNGAFWGYYTSYNENGSPAWWLFTSAGPTIGSNQFNFELREYSGPGIGNIWDTSKLSSRVAGTGQLTMDGPGRMTLDVQLGSTQRRLALVPFDTP